MSIYSKLLILLGFFTLTFMTSCDPDPITNPKEDPKEDPKDTTDTDTFKPCYDYVSFKSYFPIFDYMVFLNENEGWAYGSGNDFSKKKLIHTEDGGKTWVVINDDFQLHNHGSFYGAKSLNFINSTTGFSYGKQNMPFSTINYTTDKGATWQPVKGIPEDYIGFWTAMSSNSTETVFIDEDGTKLCFVSNTTFEARIIDFYVSDQIFEINSFIHLAEDGTINTFGRAVGENGHYITERQLLHSPDGGVTWTWTECNPDYYEDMKFPTDDIGYFLYKDDEDKTVIKKTIDGGATWTDITIDNVKIYDFDFVDADNGIAIVEVFENGLWSVGNIATTSDGGLTWQVDECIRKETKILVNDDIIYTSPNKALIKATLTKDGVFSGGIYLYEK